MSLTMAKIFRLLAQIDLNTLSETNESDDYKALKNFLCQLDIYFKEFIVPKESQFDPLAEADNWLREIRLAYGLKSLTNRCVEEHLEKLDAINGFLGGVGEQARYLLEMYQALDTIRREAPGVIKIKNILHVYKVHLEARLKKEGLSIAMESNCPAEQLKRPQVSLQREKLCNRYKLVLTITSLVRGKNNLDDESQIVIQQFLVQYIENKPEWIEWTEKDFIDQLMEILNIKTSCWSFFSQNKKYSLVAMQEPGEENIRLNRLN